MDVPRFSTIHTPPSALFAGATIGVSIRRVPQGDWICDAQWGWNNPSDFSVSIASARVKAAMQAERFSGVAVPLEVEAITADPVEAGEGRVKLFAEILREAGAVALNEAILGAVPLAEDIDGIVELRRPDGGQEAGLQEVVDQVPTGGGHRRFFCRGKTARSHVSSWLTPPRHSLAWAFASSRAEAHPTCG